MITSLSLSVAHLVGLAWAVGAATAKTAMVLRCRADVGFVPVYLEVAKALTRQIILGMILLTLSGIGLLLLGYPFTRLLVVKLVLVAAIFAAGPIIDNVVEPKFRQLAPAKGEAASSAFREILGRYVALEIAATLAFYVIIVLWIFG